MEISAALWSVRLGKDFCFFIDMYCYCDIYENIALYFTRIFKHVIDILFVAEMNLS